MQNTIVRTKDGLVHVAGTVRKTILHLTKQPGYLSVDTIRHYINYQLPEREKLSRHMVVQALVRILEKGIDKTGTA